MARPRKPTQLHVVSGSAKKHPDRMRERQTEPEVSDFDLRTAEPPEHLSEELAKLWREVCQHLHARVAAEQDAIALEALVRLVALMRSGDAAASDYARLQAYLGEFGMTPASRSKVSQAKRPDAPKGFAALKAG